VYGVGVEALATGGDHCTVDMLLMWHTKLFPKYSEKFETPLIVDSPVGAVIVPIK
jgi:hypothetical protein